MPTCYLLPSPHGHHYYATAQLAAFAVYVALLLGQGYRRGYPQRTWLPLVAAATLALVLGCQLVLLAPGRWLGWLGGEAEAVQALAGGPRSVVGGAVASFLAVLGLRRALGFRGWGVLDAFAGPLCWALAVQSVGCLLAGCCWGETTAGPWGVAYGPGAPAYAAQLAQGLLATGAAHTLPLVPTQLLHLLLCVGTGLLLHATRRRAVGWPGGSRYLLAMGLLCLGRFAIEGLRDPDSEPLLADACTLGGISLSGLRWFMLLEAVGQLGLWAWLVRRAPAPAAEVLPAPHPAAPTLVGLGLLLATARLAPTVLSLPEIAVLQALLLLVLLAEGRTLLVTLGRGVPRLAGMPLALLLSGALLLATAQAPAPQKAAVALDPAPSRALTFSVGSLGSQYDEYAQGGCGSPSYAYYHRIRAVGGEAAYQKTELGRAADAPLATFGAGLWAGTDEVGTTQLNNGSFVVQPPTYTVRNSFYDAHLYYERQHFRSTGPDVSYRLGLHLGQLPRNRDLSSSAATVLLPELMVSLGRQQTLFGQVDLGYGAENALAGYTSRLALGSGLGQRNGSTLLVGYAAAYHYPTYNMAFASANLRLPARTGLSVEPYFATDFDRHNLFSVKLHYQLGLK